MTFADKSPPPGHPWLLNWIRLNGNALSWILLLVGLLLVGSLAGFR